MKKLLVILLLFVASFSNACEIQFTILKGEKITYSENDTLVVSVKVSFTHRVCGLDISDTKFKLKGLKVIGSKDWKEVEPGVFERKLKLLVTSKNDGQIIMNTTRSCDKAGGFGSIRLKHKK